MIGKNTELKVLRDHSTIASSKRWVEVVNVWGKRFKLPQLTHKSFLAILYVTYSTTHQRSVEVQFGRYQNNILQERFMVKKLSCVSCGSLKRFPNTFTSTHNVRVHIFAVPEL